MIIVLRDNAKEDQLQQLEKEVVARGLEIIKTEGVKRTIWSLIGDTSTLDVDGLANMPAVDFVKRIQKPYREVDRSSQLNDTIVTIGDGTVTDQVRLGGGIFLTIAGPCSVESENQMRTIAAGVKTSGAQVLRGGAFKPRTSPYAFQGLKEEGMDILKTIRKETRMPVITEIMDVRALDLFEDVDVIQVGARNMQNYELLKELGHQDKPVLLKRGISATLQELLLSAEYVMRGGNNNVILCERGIRTFETATRNTLDLSAVPLLKEMTHLPIVVDPSHATGLYSLVPPMALAAVAAGADGLMIEVHNEPATAYSDGLQSINLERFDDMMKQVRAIRPFAYKG